MLRWEKLRLAALFVVGLTVLVSIQAWKLWRDLKWQTATLGWRQFLEQTVAVTPPLREALTGREGILTARGIIAATNKERARYGLLPLQENQSLSAAARRKIADMFARQYFSHENPEGKYIDTLVSAEGYSFLRVGENLALGFFPSDERLVAAWMKSPEHRKNILERGYREMGAAAAPGTMEGKRVWLAVQVFALPTSACPQVDKEALATLHSRASQLSVLEKELEKERPELRKLAARRDQLIGEVKHLAKEVDEKMKKGNAFIEQGNEVYRQTGEKEQAEELWQQGKRLQQEARDLLEQMREKAKQANILNERVMKQQDAFNAKVDRYNTLLANLQQARREIQRQVSALQQCVQQWGAEGKEVNVLQ
jgi:hypothetical protein